MQTNKHNQPLEQMKVLFFSLLLSSFFVQSFGLKNIIELPRNKLRSFSVFKPRVIVDLVRAYHLAEIIEHEIKKQRQLEYNRKLEEKRQKKFREHLLWRANGSSFLKDYTNRI